MTTAESLKSNPEWEYKWRYTLPADLILDVLVSAPCAVSCQWGTITPITPAMTRFVLKKGYSWDGCSVVPDAPGTENASCLHDFLCQYSERIASLFGWSENKTLYWANGAFFKVMRMDDCPVARLYYVGVQLFCPLYHKIASWF